MSKNAFVCLRYGQKTESAPDGPRRALKATYTVLTSSVCEHKFDDRMAVTTQKTNMPGKNSSEKKFGAQQKISIVGNGSAAPGRRGSGAGAAVGRPMTGGSKAAGRRSGPVGGVSERRRLAGRGPRALQGSTDRAKQQATDSTARDKGPAGLYPPSTQKFALFLKKKTYVFFFKSKAKKKNFKNEHPLKKLPRSACLRPYGLVLKNNLPPEHLTPKYVEFYIN